VHIEHGSDYVKLWSKFKSYISYLYDKIIWKWIFKRADKILAISEASKKFIIRDFVNRKIDVFYRGINIPDIVEGGENLKEKFPQKIIIWYVWRLYKWKNVESLIKAYEGLDDKYKIESSLVIVWDGEDYNYLKSISKDENIYFAWWKSFEEALDYQKQFDIHIHSSSPWWWLATTLLQAMYFWNLIVATPNEWANEVIIDWKNWFLLKSDSIEELKNWIEKSLENLDKKEVFAKENKKIIMEKFSRKNNIKILYNLIK
jgi:glycosyltransferase involved in cell wall biosynthesis